MVRILDGSAIDRLVPGIRGILGARGRRVLKLVEGLSYVCGHGDVTYAWNQPVYGAAVQYADHPDDSPLLPPNSINLVQ